MMFGHFKGY